MKKSGLHKKNPFLIFLKNSLFSSTLVATTLYTEFLVHVTFTCTGSSFSCTHKFSYI